MPMAMAKPAREKRPYTAWEAEHAEERHDPEWYLANVLPGLAGVTLTAIAKATGMSTSNAAKVRSGNRVPHSRWWLALQALSGAAVDSKQ